MGVYYTDAGEEVKPYLDQVLSGIHQALHEEGVTFCLQFAFRKTADGEDADRPAISHHGYPALALISVGKLRDRAAGHADVRILIDGRRWQDLSEPEKTAVLDHELEHLVLIRDVDGTVKRDDVGRPKLKLRPHDCQIGLFFSVVQRHGIHAVESQAYRELHREMTQRQFPWG